MAKYCLFLLSISFYLVACNQASEEADTKINTELYTLLQEKLITASPGTTVEIPEGVFEFDRPLSLDGISNITIKGKGMNKTILSFKNQKVGAEGLKITADSVSILALCIRDTKGDAIKIQDSKNILLKNVKTSWTGGAKETNGGYGIYPVSCQNVLIDSCEAAYASDAGIYVGQSQNVVVRNNYVYENVAGIEIENCINSEVYNNISQNNTGGILVFDLPDLQVVNGHTCKVFQNQIIENNHKNFAPKGNIVGIVPPGTGIILLAAKNVHIFNNEIIGHKTMGTSIASYQITEKSWKDQSYDPYSYNIFIYNNNYKRKRTLPDLSTDFGKLINYLFPGQSQDIIYDGILKEENTGKNPMNLCIQQEKDNLRFANVDAANDFDNVSKDLAIYDCKQGQLPEVIFN